MFIKSIFKNIYKTLQDGVKGPVIVFCGLFLPPLYAAMIWSNNMVESGFIFTSVLAAIIFSAEVAFSLVYRLFFGQAYESSPRIPFDDLYIEPHPYIPYIYKARALSQKGGEAIYPLHNKKYTFGQYRTNNFRFNNGPTGERDIIVPKPSGLIRVNCLGASTTGNYLEYDGEVYSYPIILEKTLRQKNNRDIEVNNCGQGGYNSADIFVRFALQVIDTEPDIVVIYHAYNDIRSYLTNDFSSDYSHARRNLGDNYWKFAIAGRIPRLPLGFLNFLVDTWLPGNIRNSLLEQVSRGAFDLDNDPTRGLQTYRRNVKHIIDLCKANGIKVVLSTYCHFLHSAIRESPVHQLYGQIVERENEITRSLAKDCDVALVDNAALVPKEEKYFVDSVHFSPEGMQLIGDNIAKAVLSTLKDQSRAP